MAAVVTQSAVRGDTINTGRRTAVITAAETNQLSTLPAKVGQLIVWGDTAGTSCILDIYDDDSANSNKKFRWVTATGLGVFALQLPLGTGFRVVTSGTLPVNGGFTLVGDWLDE